MGGKRILSTQRYSLYEILETAYPDKPLEDIKFKSGYFKKTQRLIYSMLKTMFPKEGFCL